MKKHLILIFSIIFSIQVFGNDFISKEQAHKLVKEQKALLLDVRTLIEFKLKHIPGAKRISIGDVEESKTKIEKMAGGKSKPIVVYCMSGGRSSKAKSILEKSGFTNVHNLGGMSRWFD
ncbi:MAG: rhodanese-like domain-containing protein [Bacteriovoracaceae bacterium]|nr:rhodanese-like domain-containing protein [Bacteriovoracaceae bacterium]